MAKSLAAPVIGIVIPPPPRLDAARDRARAAGLAGAMFPWRSGSDGTEDTLYGTPFTPLNHYSPWKVDDFGTPVEPEEIVPENLDSVGHQPFTIKILLHREGCPQQAHRRRARCRDRAAGDAEHRDHEEAQGGVQCFISPPAQLHFHTS